MFSIPSDKYVAVHFAFSLCFGRTNRPYYVRGRGETGLKCDAGTGLVSRGQVEGLGDTARRFDKAGRRAR